MFVSVKIIFRLRIKDFVKLLDLVLGVLGLFKCMVRIFLKECECVGGDGVVVVYVEEGCKVKLLLKGVKVKGKFFEFSEGKVDGLLFGQDVFVQVSVIVCWVVSVKKEKLIKSVWGIFIGKVDSVWEWVVGGFNLVVGLDMLLEEVEEFEVKLKQYKKDNKKKFVVDGCYGEFGGNQGVIVIVEVLLVLIESGNLLYKNGEVWIFYWLDCLLKLEGGVEIVFVFEYEFKGDQFIVIVELVEGMNIGEQIQVLFGVIGLGKIYIMVQVIQCIQCLVLILVFNKIFVVQFYGEFKFFFLDNVVEYFVFYYDYYQLEVYVLCIDIYIEKESLINEQIDWMCYFVIWVLLECDDVIIVVLVLCIYGIGLVEIYMVMIFVIEVGECIDQCQLIVDLVVL